MILPNFLIIGAAKCATSSLASLLDAHPQAAIIKGKESHFGSNEVTRDMYLDTYNFILDKRDYDIIAEVDRI